MSSQPREGESVEDGNKSGEINKWCVENSWGEKLHEKGYLTMSDNWFRQFVYMAVVDASHLSESAKAAVDKPAHVLPPWDPLGTLA